MAVCPGTFNSCNPKPKTYDVQETFTCSMRSKCTVDTYGGVVRMSKWVGLVSKWRGNSYEFRVY